MPTWDDDMDEFEGFAFGDELVTDIIRKAREAAEAKSGAKNPAQKKATPKAVAPKAASKAAAKKKAPKAAAAAPKTAQKAAPKAAQKVNSEPTNEDWLTEERANAAGLEIDDTSANGDGLFSAIITALLDGSVAPRDGKPTNPEKSIADIALSIIDDFFDNNPDLLADDMMGRSAEALRILLAIYIFRTDVQFSLEARDRIYGLAERIDKASKQAPSKENQLAKKHPEIAQSMTDGYAQGGIDMDKLEKAYMAGSFYPEETTLGAMTCIFPMRFVIIDIDVEEGPVSVVQPKRHGSCYEFGSYAWIILKRVQYQGEAQPRVMLLRPQMTGNAVYSNPLMSREALRDYFRALKIKLPLFE